MQAKVIWEAMCPTEPFELKEAAVPGRYAQLQAQPPKSNFDYKIADAVDRQQAFWYQVGPAPLFLSLQDTSSSILQRIEIMRSTAEVLHIEFDAWTVVLKGCCIPKIDGGVPKKQDICISLGPH